MELYLERKHWDMMLAHVRAHAPLEACGLLVGKNNRVEEVLLIRNEAKSRVRFRMDPKEQLEAFDWIESHNLELIGIFHSHPSGPETVSATDVEEAAYAVAQVVWSRMKDQWNARGFWIEDQRIAEVDIKVIEVEQP
jgi:[CysO sulfur-carrier protein]-S-L-cysteine hydrolase